MFFVKIILLASNGFFGQVDPHLHRKDKVLAGSKRTFGLVKSSIVAVLVDTSDVNTGFGRLSTFKESLLVRTFERNFNFYMSLCNELKLMLLIIFCS